MTKRKTWNQVYQDSPLQAQHARIKAHIFAALGGDEIAAKYRDAFDSVYSTRGKTRGQLKATKPSDRHASIVWEGYSHFMQQYRAHRLGVGPAYGSVGGAMCSIMFGPERASDAFEATMDACILELKHGNDLEAYRVAQSAILDRIKNNVV